MSLAFLFPCQGSQRPGMLSRLPANQIKDHYLATASEVIGYEITDLESEQSLASTEATQIALYLAEVIGFETLMGMGVKPFYCAGHSIGAFAAAVACGTLDFATGLEVVRRRAALMQSAFPSGYGMGVIVGMDETSAKQMVIELASGGHEIFLAIINSRHEIVVTGKVDNVDVALAFARLKNVRRAGRLSVATPSQCVLLHDVAKEMRSLFSSVRVLDPSIPYIANRTGKLLRDGYEIWEDLMACIEYPVRWYDMSTTLVEAGVSIFIEMPPGRTLSNLIQSAFPWARSYAADDHEPAWLARAWQYLSARQPVAIPRPDVDVW